MSAAPDMDGVAARIAAAIGDPARARILYCLLDNRARTSSELAMVARVSPSTASVHLHRLSAARLVSRTAHGKYRYYGLNGADVASVLERLSVLAGGLRDTIAPDTPNRLRTARTCYDHIAGVLGVALHDRLIALGWLGMAPHGDPTVYDVTRHGTGALEAVGVQVAAARALRRRFAYACMDWSERRAHLGGAMGAAMLQSALKRSWVTQERESRALTVTGLGQRELLKHFGVHV